MTNDERDKMILETHDAVIGIVDKVKSHQTDLYGNGKSGIKIDVDRLKIFNKAQCWVGGVLLVASLGVLAKFAYSHFVK